MLRTLVSANTAMVISQSIIDVVISNCKHKDWYRYSHLSEYHMPSFTLHRAQEIWHFYIIASFFFSTHHKENSLQGLLSIRCAEITHLSTHSFRFWALPLFLNKFCAQIPHPTILAGSPPLPLSFTASGALSLRSFRLSGVASFVFLLSILTGDVFLLKL